MTTPTLVRPPQESVDPTALRPSPADRAAPAPPAEPNFTVEPGPELPLPTFPRRIPVWSADGRRWDLLTSPSDVTAVGPAGTVARASITERDEQVLLSFWVDRRVPRRELAWHLVRQAFGHPAVRPGRRVLVSLPRGDTDLLLPVRGRLHDAGTRVAGVTCLLEGTVGSAARVQA
jgi:hypothetical protein